VIKKIVGDPELVFHFFALFSRFEYASKRCKYLRTDSENRAEPNWKDYGDSLNGKFTEITDAGFKKAYDYLQHDPPKTQIVRGDKNLDWVEIVGKSKESEENYILRLVRTVRNNLFHGGKFPLTHGPEPETARNQKLIKDSIEVLEQCLRLSPEVQKYFEEIPED